jgi:hypothetical protein
MSGFGRTIDQSPFFLKHEEKQPHVAMVASGGQKLFLFWQIVVSRSGWMDLS